LDRLRLAPLVLVMLAAAACGSGRPSRLLSGERAAEFRPVKGSVIAEGRVVRRMVLGDRFETCLFRGDRSSVAANAAVVERIGIRGESLTFANRRGTGVYGCDGGSDAAGERHPPWCGEVFGTLIGARLLDPRLDVNCRDRDGRPLAYAFVQPVVGAHWIGVDQGRYVEIYEVLGRLPVRVSTTRGIDAAQAQATFAVTQYDVHGRELVRQKMEAGVAG
jgi:hypothetical protein